MVSKTLITFFGLTILALGHFAHGSQAIVSRMVPQYPRAELVESSDTGEIARHEVILGTVKKSDGIDRPEASRFVVGRRITSTWFIPDEQRTNVVRDFYRERLSALGDIVFECEGYRCGSSSYWANTVFGKSILYGPAEYQRYFLTQIEADKTWYVGTYVALRGTRKLYTHVDIVVTDKLTSAVDGASIVAALESNGRFVIAAGEEDATTAAIVETLQIKPRMRIAVVRHGEKQQGESISEAIDRTGVAAREFARQLVAEGADENRVEGFGVGPLVPMERDAIDRTEIVLISPN